jgi:polyferredoxin
MRWWQESAVVFCLTLMALNLAGYVVWGQTFYLMVGLFTGLLAVALVWLWRKTA